MKRLVIGILAHVDSGKTTLSEAMLYQAGALRKLGRVDHRDAFLDTDALERARASPFLPSRRCSPCRRPSSPCWTPRATWTSPPRRSGRCR